MISYFANKDNKFPQSNTHPPPKECYSCQPNPAHVQGLCKNGLTLC